MLSFTLKMVLAMPQRWHSTCTVFYTSETLLRQVKTPSLTDLFSIWSRLHLLSFYGHVTRILSTLLFITQFFTNSKNMCVPIVLRPPPGSFASIWISSTWQGTYKSSQTKIQLIMPRLLSTLNIPISLYILYSKPLLFTLAWCNCYPELLLKYWKIPWEGLKNQTAIQHFWI